jgi:2-oxoglutarate ferredoxin oxidoreductase subunit gamma
VPRPDILVVMSQEAYGLFAPQLKDEGTLIIEEDLVRIGELPAGVRVYSVPATRIAEELGKKMVLNIVMVGFFGAITQVVEREALRNAVGDSVPPAYRELNLKAFDRGFEYGVKELTEVIVKQESEVAVAALEN